MGQLFLGDAQPLAQVPDALPEEPPYVRVSRFRSTKHALDQALDDDEASTDYASRLVPAPGPRRREDPMNRQGSQLLPIMFSTLAEPVVLGSAGTSVPVGPSPAAGVDGSRKVERKLRASAVTLSVASTAALPGWSSACETSRDVRLHEAESTGAQWQRRDQRQVLGPPGSEAVEHLFKASPPDAGEFSEVVPVGITRDAEEV